MQRPRAVGVVIVSLLFASSWGASIRAAEEEGSFQGEIMHVQRAEEKSSPKGFLGTLLVEKERKPTPDKMSFAVTEKTTIFRRIGGFRVPASFKPTFLISTSDMSSSGFPVVNDRILSLPQH